MEELFEQSKSLRDSLSGVYTQSRDVVKELNKKFPDGFSMYIPTISVEDYVNSTRQYTDNSGEPFALIGLGPAEDTILVSYVGSNKCTAISCGYIESADFVEIVFALCSFITPKQKENVAKETV